jgi:hypothetical protein
MSGFPELVYQAGKEEQRVELGPNGTSLDLLRIVYRSASIPLPVRMRAAIAALPFEAPKLAVTAIVTEHDFATLLDQRIKNMERINNGNGGVIEAKPVPQVEARPQMPRVADRRFRRI